MVARCRCAFLTFGRAIVAGERDPEVLAAFRDIRCHSSIEVIKAALVGNDRDEHIFALPQSLELYNVYQAKIGDCDYRLRSWLDESSVAGHSARQILCTRYAHFPKTIAARYDPNEMPDDPRAAYQENDDLLESIYLGRRFRNDTKRLEHLFKHYAARVKQIDEEVVAKKAVKTNSNKRGVAAGKSSETVCEGLV